MGDLYFDDIQDEKAYPDETILRDVRALINAGQRESFVLDYKKDVSDKDNWPEAVVAFANTFGGLIIFGVVAKGDKPHTLTGFDPHGVEIKTRLVSTLLSRIQPRPDLQVRVVTLDTDPIKEVAILRISEGSQPPYMHSKGDEHRVYIRVGAQKAEADYLQLSALLEKRGKTESPAASFLTSLSGSQSQLYIREPLDPNVRSRNWYNFILAPDDNRAARRLTIEVERQFAQCIEHLYGQPHPSKLVIRTQAATYFRRGTGTGSEQRFAVTANGSLGFATLACIRTNDGPFFLPLSFCRDLIDFLILAASFYEKSYYYGGNLLEVSLQILDRAQLYSGVPTRNRPNQGSGLFDPPLESIQVAEDVPPTQIRVSLHPLTTERLRGYLEAVMNELARYAGSVLSTSFAASTQPLVEDGWNRLHAT
jgi:Putative DNA-binding domain